MDKPIRMFGKVWRMCCYFSHKTLPSFSNSIINTSIHRTTPSFVCRNFNTVLYYLIQNMLQRKEEDSQ
jgi:hypothetical protein